MASSKMDDKLAAARGLHLLYNMYGALTGL